MPGDPAFVAADQAAHAERLKAPTGTLPSILQADQDSPKFTDLAPRTRRDYTGHVGLIEAKFGDFPLAGFSDTRTRGEFLGWRDTFAKKSRRQADSVFSTFAAILGWAFDRGVVTANPSERSGKLYRSGRAESVWAADDEAAFLKVAPDRLRLAFLLAIWTGQRQGDLLRLTWSAYDGTHIRLRQSKTGRRVVIPVAGPLKAVLDAAAARRKAVTILATITDTCWTSDGFSASWRKAVAKAKVAGLTFHDLRGTAITRLAVAGCSEAEIATITGHSLRDVGAILDAHYLSRDARLAESGMRKREVYEAGTPIPE